MSGQWAIDPLFADISQPLDAPLKQRLPCIAMRFLRFLINCGYRKYSKLYNPYTSRISGDRFFVWTKFGLKICALNCPFHAPV
jgi:hypothetical protein